MEPAAVKRILGDCSYDPSAPRSYDIMRGGFVWDDELPSANIGAILLLSEVIAYRASLTLGQPDSEHEAAWNELSMILPSWPGFRHVRIYGQVERDLRAVKLREDRCLAKLEKEIDLEDP